MLCATRDRVDEVAHVDQAAPVAHAREGQGQPRIDPTEQAQKVGLDLGSVHEGRPDQHELHAVSGGGFGQGPLGFELGATVGVPRIERVVFTVGTVARVPAWMGLDRWAIAARWTIVPTPSAGALRSNSAAISGMRICSNWGGTAPGGIRRLTAARTVWPRASSSRQRAVPTKPDAPVTRMRM